MKIKDCFVKPLISIVIPAYNCEKYIRRCLESIKAQTHENFEALIVDDGSSDKTGEICREFSEFDKRFVYFYKENGGVSAARNYALDRAHGEYIGFVDGDDEALPDMFEVLLSGMLENRADVSVISPIVATLDGKKMSYCDSGETVLLSSENAVKEMLSNGLFAGHLCTKLFKKECFEKVRLRTDFAICEDLVAIYEILTSSEKTVYIGKHKYVYYINPDSAVNTGFKESFLTFITACEYLAQRTKTDFPSAVPHAKSALVTAYLDVMSKLYYAKRLDKPTFKKYKAELKSISSKEVKRLLPFYKRAFIMSIKLGRVFYILALKCFNIAKRAVYKIKLKQ